MSEGAHEMFVISNKWLFSQTFDVLPTIMFMSNTSINIIYVNQEEQWPQHRSLWDSTSHH